MKLMKFATVESIEGNLFQINVEHITWLECTRTGGTVLFDNGYSIDVNRESGQMIDSIIQRHTIDE